MTSIKRIELKRPPWGGGSDAEEISFGTWLRQQREMREINLREIAESTKISLRYLDAFEQDRFDVLPSAIFSRGFLRQYAGYVGLDVDEVINHFLWAQREVQPEIEEEAEGPQTSGVLMPLLLAAAGVLLVALLIGFLYFYYDRSERDVPKVPREEFVPRPQDRSVVPPPPVPEAAPPPAAPEAVPAEAVPAEAVPAGAVPAGVVPAASGDAASDAVPAASGAVAPATSLPPGVALLVTLDFSQECWTEIIVDGTPRISRLYEGGQSERIEARRSVVLRKLGNIEGVRVSVNGRSLKLPQGRGKVLADLRIDAATVQQLAGATP